MPNCRRRFSTEQEVKKHIDNHMNPNSTKGRKKKNANNNNNNNNNVVAVPNATQGTPDQNHIQTQVSAQAQDIAAVVAAHQQDSKSAFLTKDMQNNIIPRMTPGIVKHELYFPPQCYGPPFNGQTFNGANQQGPPQPPSTTTTQPSTTNNSSTSVNTPTAAVVQWRSIDETVLPPPPPSSAGTTTVPRMENNTTISHDIVSTYNNNNLPPPPHYSRDKWEKGHDNVKFKF